MPKAKQESCMRALFEAQSIIQLIDEQYGEIGTEPDEPDEVARVTAALRVARRRLDEGMDAFFREAK